MNQRIEYNLCPAGLGTIITQISFLLATGREAVAWVPNENNIAWEIKRIFGITDDQMTIALGINGDPWIESDELCTYAPYLHSDFVNLFGQQFSTARKKKPCVALAMHHGCGLGDNMEFKSMPYNKFGSMQDYSLIWRCLVEHGYDVVVINQPTITIEQKVYLLNELCDFMICYEGGMAHLAHCLKLPTIMLPWKYNDMGHEPSYPGILYESHRFHADPHTYFLNSVDEFLSWNTAQLAGQLEQLHQGHGNNLLFQPGTVLNPDTLEIHAQNNMNLTPRIIWCQTRGQQATSYIKQNLPVERMIKYPLKSMT